MGIKDLKHRKQLGGTVRIDLLEELNKLSKESGIPKTRLIDKALEMLLAEYSNKDFIKINVSDD